MSIFIFSRPVRSGKTSSLQRWCDQKKNTAGILMPDINGKRKITDIRTREIIDLECENPGDCQEEHVHIGRFCFHEQAFKIAQDLLLKTLALDPDWFIIDEVGNLELDKKGFYEAVKTVTEAYNDKSRRGNLLLVVRHGLYEKVIAFFKINDPVLLHDPEKIV